MTVLIYVDKSNGYIIKENEGEEVEADLQVHLLPHLHQVEGRKSKRDIIKKNKKTQRKI
jgi:hypothetical protein